ncbi:MAG: ComEC family competence protein [Saprospiraceae bacterium]|nr:MAG: ComEC family competence protein [Saprospiraceae bacterium]
MLNWREFPFVRLTIALMAGIVLQMFLDYDSTTLIALSLVLIIPLFFIAKMRGRYRYRWLFGVLLGLALAALGFHLAWYHNELNDAAHFSRGTLPEESFLAGNITDAPAETGKWVKVELMVKAFGPAPDSLKPKTGRLLLYLAKDAAALALNYGDALLLHGRIMAVPPPENPHVFDYRRYLHFQNIHYQTFVRGSDWKRVSHGCGNRLFGMALALQKNFVHTLRKHLTTPEELAVGSALILGYRNEMPEEIKTAYIRTGAMHVLAVSGLHVGIVFLLLNFSLKRILKNSRAWRIARMLLILLAIWAFALITGASPSVVRAAVMFSFINVGLLLRQYASIYNTLASSAFCLLLWNPYWLASVSFQLSYLAVYGIVYFQSKISRLWIIENKAGRQLWELVCVSLAAQLMTLPLTLFYFHQFPTFFWLSSLILVPASGFVLGGGLLLLAVEAVSPGLAFFVGKGLWALLWFCNKSVFIIGQLPGAVVKDIPIGAGASLLLYLALLGIMAAISFKHSRWVLAALSLFVLAGGNYAFTIYRQLGHPQAVVYNIYKHTAIDFFDGKRVCSLTDTGLDERTLSFAAGGHRLFMGANECRTFSLNDTCAHASGRWFFQRGFVQFQGTRWAIVSAPPDAAPDEKIAADYLVVRGSPKLKIEDLTAVFDFKKIIFDATNKKWQVAAWKKACERLNAGYYDVNTSGAFVLDIEPPKQRKMPED